MCKRRGLVRVVPEPSNQARVVEHERDARERDPRPHCTLHCERELPGGLPGCLHERVRGRSTTYCGGVAGGQ